MRTRGDLADKTLNLAASPSKRGPVHPRNTTTNYKKCLHPTARGRSALLWAQSKSMKSFISTLLLAIACFDEARPPASTAEDAAQLIAADLSGTGTDVVIRWDSGSLTWPGGSQTIEGRLVAYDVGPGEGNREAVGLVFGRGKSSPQATPSAWVLTDEALAPVDVQSSRLSDVQVIKGGIALTEVGKDKTTRMFATTGDNKRELATSVMGLRGRQLDDSGTVAVGRLYGDQPRSHGGLEIHRPGAPPTRIETVRGVRTLAVGDVDGDGHKDLVFADGWHFRYAKDAEASLGILPGPDFRDPVRIGQIADSYTIDAIEFVGPGRILAVGTSSIVLFKSTAVGWRQETLSTRGQGGLPTVWRSKGRWLPTRGSKWLIYGQKGREPLFLEPN